MNEVLFQLLDILARVRLVRELGVEHDLEIFETCELSHGFFVWETAES